MNFGEVCADEDIEGVANFIVILFFKIPYLIKLK